MNRRALVLVLAAGWLAASCGGRKPDPANQLPFGNIDIPANGATVNRGLTVAGWAQDDTGVTRIDIYVDGYFRVSTTQTVARPDVVKAFPKYQHGETLGWQAPLDLGEGAGVHKIIAQAVDTNGATADLGTVSVTSTGKAR